MINPSTAYPTRTAAPTPGMPFGSARDATSANDPAATPFTALVLNDVWGLMQALASAGGVVPSGIAEAVGSSQLLPLLQSGGGSLAGATVYSAPVSLTAAQVGKGVLLAAGAGAVALPPTAGTKAGDMFRIFAQVQSTISVAGGASMQVGGALQTSFVIPAGTEVVAVSTGPAWWVFGTALIQSPIGVGQSWQNLTSSRVANTVYTNGTGRPIEVAVTLQGTASVDSWTAYVSGVPIYSGDPGTGSPSTSISISFIVPAGAIYSLNGSGGVILTWVELR